MLIFVEKYAMLIGYARVSTEDQSLNVQIKALNKAKCEIIYQEKIGAMKERPELTKMLNSLTKGDTLIVYKLDRLGRSLTHLAHIMDTLQNKGIEFISLVDNFDTTTTQGKMLLGITMVFAEFERNLISDRTKASLKMLKSKGVKLGRRPYLSNEAKTKAKLARKMTKYHKVGWICSKLEISKPTYYRYLKIK